MPNYWLLKTEPSTYSYDDLERDQRTTWDGVANPVALKHLRSMAVGDHALIYHTGDEKRIVGVAKVTRAAYPDPKQQDDRLAVVDLAAVRRVETPVTLATIKADHRFTGFDLVRLPRLSVMPVEAPYLKPLLALLGE
jgi:predicted RNA-binding protein with PUA-like domain